MTRPTDRSPDPDDGPAAGFAGRARFIARMAWRDSRASRRRLFLFALCIVVGISALVAVGSFGRSLEVAIRDQAKALLGADLSIGSRIRFTAEHEAFLNSVGGEQAREITFSSMIQFPSQAGTRLVQVRALDGGFPFYGQIETEPAQAAALYQSEGGVLIEESLLGQFGASVGDLVRLGDLTTRIAGALRRVPGESVAFASMAPRVYLRMADLEATGLLRDRSLARFRVFYRLPQGFDIEGWVKANEPHLDRLRLRATTVQEREEDLGQAMRNLYHFLNLVGFVALLLGGVGVASAIQVHVQQKIPTVAILRCLGCPVWVAFSVYLVQGMALGVVGAGLGAVTGVWVQRLLPRVVADFIPFKFEAQTSWAAIGEATTFGFAMCVLFALLPLTAIRQVSPLAVLRVAYEPAQRWDRLRWLVATVLAVVVLAFAVVHTERWYEGLGFAGGLVAVFGILTLVARLVIWVTRRLRSSRYPFALRQGLANIHRPNNRTLLLVVSLGLATFLLLTLHMIQTTLLRELIAGRETGQPNAILFDIQTDQREDVASLLRAEGFPIMDEAPIVTMRLDAIKGRPVAEILGDRETGIPRWALRREFRSTYTDQLRASEEIIAGRWIPSISPEADSIPVSVEEGIARELGVTLGDTLAWDVQGVSIQSHVASLRKVDWRRVQPNFFVLFPRGPLDDAPAFHVLVTRVRDAQESARLQRSVVQRFPNVSTIDITLILRTLDQVLGKIAFAIRFMALFTVVTGLLVLVASVLSGRYQRVRESILLRVLGASRRQVLRVLWVEYTLLGLLAATTGVALAFLASAALALGVFNVPFVPALGPAAAAVLIVTVLTVTTGWFASRGVTTHPPLEILRSDG